MLDHLTPTPFGFVGKAQYQTDGDSGLQLLGHRYYDPSIGRFLSSDPAQGGTNWYAYCDNNPLKRTDRTGLEPPVIGPGYTNGQRDELKELLKTIKSTDRGRQLFGGGGTPITIVPLKPTDPGYPYPFTTGLQPIVIPHRPDPVTIHFDPFGPGPPVQLMPPIPYLPNPYFKLASPIQMLAHELGHAATGTLDDGEDKMNNVNQNENPILSQLGLPTRISYSPFR